MSEQYYCTMVFLERERFWERAAKDGLSPKINSAHTFRFDVGDSKPSLETFTILIWVS